MLVDILENGQLFQPLLGQVFDIKLGRVSQSLIGLSGKSWDLPPLQIVTTKAYLLSLSCGHSHPGHP